MVTNQEKKTIITIEDNVYFTTMQVIKTAENTVCKLGESFTITLIERDKSCCINYVNSSKVRIFAKDLDFMISYMENGYFKINDEEFPFDRTAADLSNFNIKEQKQRLEFAKKAVVVLDILNCTKDVDMLELSIEDLDNYERLITAFVDKQPVMNLKPDLPPIIKMSVGTLSFALCFQACEKIKSAYNIYDFFKTEMSLVYDGIDGEKLPTSQYSILHADDFLTVDNMRFDVLLPTFQKAQKHYDTYNRANWFLIDLLTAFDKSGGKRTEILKTAHEFADWIFHGANEDELPYQIQIQILNYLQLSDRGSLRFLNWKNCLH